MTRQRISSLVVAAMFASFAYVQHNDVDPGRWIALYLGAGALCIALAWDAPVRRAAWAVVAACGVLGAWWLKERGVLSVDDEVVRETGGLWVVALAVASFARRGRSGATR